MPSFLISTSTGSSNLNFFHSGDYTSSSYSASWSTRTTPDSEGLDTPVYVLVLEKFGIPFIGGPSAGTLPGIDIKRMPALDAIRLSLAESLVNGEWWDMFEDGLGGVYFQKVFAGAGAAAEPITLDVRQCIPTSEKQNIVDLVIVRGYDSPPVREVKPFKDVVPAGTGEINPDDITGTETLFTVAPAELLSATCHSRLAHNVVYKSYRDPVKTGAFQPQEQDPFYSVKNFENLIGYVERITGLPTDPAEAARVKFGIQTTTPWYKPVVFPTFNKTTAPGCAGPGVIVDPTITYIEATFRYQSPDYNDAYGTPWPLVNKPEGLHFTGNKLIAFWEMSALRAITASQTPPITAFVGPIKELLEVSGGASWTWTLVDRGLFDISIYFQIQNKLNSDGTSTQEELWDIIAASMGGLATIKYSDGRAFDSNEFGRYGSSQRVLNIIAGPGDLGYLVEDMWLSLQVDRPCVRIEDAGGDSLGFAESFRYESAPIIITDTPVPVAYYDGTTGKIIDQSVGIADTDPTTQQNFEETELEQLQDLVQGTVLDVSFPFCTAEDCLTVAETIYNYMHAESVQTYALTCGPSSEPKLGSPVAGYSSDLVIDSINYSYNDASSYSINVTLTPIFSNIGSWGNQPLIKQTEEVERPAIIRWVAGDGVNYRVEVKGLGMYNAVSSVQAVFYPGEVVSVRIYNNPVEQ